jgi:MFS-type transporter involved in bile tolerance (Atg22 family)
MAVLANLAVAATMVGLATVMIRLTGNLPQWSAMAFGYYAVFSWAATLRRHDPATFSLIWGTPAFICTALGYGLVSLGAYALAFWSAPYAETVLKLPKEELAFVLGGGGAASGFLGVILGGRMSDWLRSRNPSGRILVIMFGIIAPVIPIWVGFTTEIAALFYAMNFLAGLFAATALGAAAATTQDLVLPHMRGTATASFFLATTLVGLAIGPYMVGQISALTGSMRIGVLSLIGVAPISLGLLIYAYRALPDAEATIAERAGAAAGGEA